MRRHGVLSKWNDDRGFGFIAPHGGGDEIFVHVSTFPRDGVRPRLDELVSFETEPGPNGKPRAVRIMRPGGGTAAARARHRRGAAGSGHSTRRRASLAILALLAVGVLGYSGLEDRAAGPGQAPAAIASPVAAASGAASADFSCDGRTLCSQMTSCAEAQYFLQHCPGVQMDGDGDGQPCEQQWCN